MALPSTVHLNAPLLPLIEGESHSKHSVSEPQEKSFLESLEPVATGIAIGLGFKEAIAGATSKEWGFLRVSQVVMGAFAVTSLAVKEAVRQARANRQGHGIG